jgi:hypothetical protein
MPYFDSFGHTLNESVYLTYSSSEAFRDTVDINNTDSSKFNSDSEEYFKLINIEQKKWEQLKVELQGADKYEMSDKELEKHCSNLITKIQTPEMYLSEKQNDVSGIYYSIRMKTDCSDWLNADEIFNDETFNDEIYNQIASSQIDELSKNVLINFSKFWIQFNQAIYTIKTNGTNEKDSNRSQEIILLTLANKYLKELRFYWPVEFPAMYP